MYTHLNFLNVKIIHNPLPWLLLVFRGGVEACCRAGFGCVDLVEKFRSLEVEKDLIIILSTETSLCLIIAIPPRPFGRADLRTDLSPDSERIEPAGALLRRRNSESVEQIQDREEFQVELGRNLEIRVRGLNNKKLPSRPITAPTSQVGEVAVVRTPVSYKCGRGLNKTNPHPNLPGVNILVWYAILQAGCIYPWKECACVAQLAHIPRPLKTTSLRGNIHSARSNPERITQLKMVGWVKPNNNNMDCRVAPAPRNDTKLVGLPTSQNTFTPDAQLAHIPRPFGEREQLFLSRQAKVTDAGEGLNINRTITHPSLPSYREGTRADAQLTYFPRPLWERAEFVSELCELRNSGEGLKNYHPTQHPPTPFGYFPRKGGRGSCAHLTPMPLVHLISRSLDHCPQKEVLS